MDDRNLAQECSNVASLARQALEWVEEPKNDPRIAQDRLFLERALRSQAYQAGRLAQSVERPMCVGVFGPSQAGKSYLVSVLARKGDTLTAIFDDPARPEVDFIQEINPYGEKEATGLVTRFTVHKPQTPLGFPVFLRLLTQTDLLKILANSYFHDGDLQEEKIPSWEDLDGHIKSFERKAQAAYVDVLREEDIWDLEDYFQRNLKRAETKVFNSFFWDRLARTAPYLGLAERADFFSILWGEHRDLTDLYRTLIESLAKLNFSEKAYCQIDALSPAATGILNVETLSGLSDAGQAAVSVSTGAGALVSLPRPIVTALAAELCINIKERPWPFFEHTDLLDFPGYRGRTRYNLTKFLADAKGNALKELFLRGKVDYLFHRYTAEQELTSMLLCLRPSNLDVTTLPAVIDDWIGVTHGRTASERQGRPVLLFFCFTMFDQHLTEKVIDENLKGPELGMRFEARLKASLLDPFAKLPDSWPRQWTPGQSFKNCYWIRNPNYKAEGVIQYEGRNEVRILPGKVNRIAELRAAYSSVTEVRAHFADPLHAFDEVMKLNDGGISCLAENLAKVCRPGMKQDQIKTRLAGIRAGIARLLAPHYIPTDLDKRLAEREAIAKAIIEDLDGCLSHNRFGTFLRGLCVDRGALADALHEPSQASAPAVRPNRLLNMVIGSGSAQVASNGKPSLSRVDGLVRTSMQVWTQHLYQLNDDQSFILRAGLSPKSLQEISNELSASARRLKIENEMRDILDKIAHVEKPQQIWAKAIIVAERVINNFVTGLGSKASDRPVRFDAAGMERHVSDFQEEFAVAWLKAFYEHLKENARTGDGLVHDAEQNLALGNLLKTLAVPDQAATSF